MINSEYSQIVERGTAASEKKVRKDARISDELSSFIRETFKDFINSGDLLWTETGAHEKFAACEPNYKGTGVLNRLNDIRHINKFLQAANENLQVGDFLVVNVETKNARRERIFDKYPKPVSRPYYLLDFILKRVMPKWKLTYKLYYSITGGRNRVLSKTETLGRLYSSGFSVLSHKRIGYNTWIIARKENMPVCDLEPIYGFFIKLNRVGVNGEMIRVYKLRTMHPFSEYIQGYVYKNNSLENGGKLKDDFRITSWGKVFRKLWIDELPMLYNWLKRDLKIVGVRPLSRHYYDLYPEEVQLLRNTVKPGLVPPYYADMPQTFEEIVESERRYIESYKMKPLRTDIRYFFTAMTNILLKRARSS